MYQGPDSYSETTAIPGAPAKQQPGFRSAASGARGCGQRAAACLEGRSRAGIPECDASGQPKVCKAITNPTTERCDGIDNDCDGNIDNGATCPSGLTCTRGRCTTICSAEFPCPGSLQCELGRCIDAACVGVTCTGAQVCRNGTCGDPCTGVVCPDPTTCSGGICIDPCTDSSTGQPVVCKDSAGNPDPKKICNKGACVTRCDCLPCGTGQACQAATGKCVETACATVTCGLGDTCVAGACVAACSKATCPTGQSCTAGKCVEEMSMDPPPLPDPNDPNNLTNGGYLDTGCACRMGTAQNNSGLILVLTGLFFAALMMRRRRA